MEFQQNVELLADLDKKEKLNTDTASSEDTCILYDTLRYTLERHDIGMATYYDMYGGILDMICDGAALKDLLRWAAMIEKMPYVHELVVKGRHYIIVHAGYTEDLKPVAGRYFELPALEAVDIRKVYAISVFRQKFGWKIVGFANRKVAPEKSQSQKLHMGIFCFKTV